jgi:hypothetical protein
MTALLPSVTITTAAAGVLGPTIQVSPQDRIGLYANFVYGSGGTTLKAWVQTSLDGGATWCDVVAFAFLLVSKRSYFNLTTATLRSTILTTFTDATLADDTAVDNLHGNLWRVKYTSTGTYAGGTTLRIDAAGAGWN